MKEMAEKYVFILVYIKIAWKFYFIILIEKEIVILRLMGVKI